MTDKQIALLREVAEFCDDTGSKRIDESTYQINLAYRLRQLADDAEKRYHEQEAERHMAAKEEKVEQCFCKSYYDENNKLQDCTCGKCEKPVRRIEKLDYKSNVWNEAGVNRGLSEDIVTITSKVDELIDVINSLKEREL